MKTGTEWRQIQSSLCEGLCSVTNVLLGCPLQSESRIQPKRN